MNKWVFYFKLIGKKLSVDGTELDPKAVANPCGIIAKTFMNDTFNVLDVNSKTFNISYFY